MLQIGIKSMSLQDR